MTEHCLKHQGIQVSGASSQITALNYLHDQEDLTLLLSLNIFQNKTKLGLLQLYSTWIQVSQVPEGILGISENLKQGLQHLLVQNSYSIEIQPTLLQVRLPYSALWIVNKTVSTAQHCTLLQTPAA